METSTEIPARNPTAECSCHLNRGILPVAFVLSVPGRHEEESKKPASGQTGENLNEALKILGADDELKKLFPSMDRYDYRITNSYHVPMYEGHESNRLRRSEPLKRWVVSKQNIADVRMELEGIPLVIACGRRAQWLTPYIGKDRTIDWWHCGGRALIKFTPAPPSDRIKEWANGLARLIKDQGHLARVSTAIA